MRLGVHVLADVVGSAPLLDKDILCHIVSQYATVLKVDSYEFEGGGWTAILLLAESHVSIHTWPEHNAYCIDCFTCGQSNTRELLERLVELLGGTPTILEIERAV